MIEINFEKTLSIMQDITTNFIQLSHYLKIEQKNKYKYYYQPLLSGIISLPR